MGDSACLMRGFSYASAIPNDSKQGNPTHVLGESVSFGRFMSESLSWERWSTFSHKKYVEEAERYAQPGSVAQKKAFFEAHYKRIAAQKAAALLEQENAAKSLLVAAEAAGNGCDSHAGQGSMSVSHLNEHNVKILPSMKDDMVIANDICSDFTGMCKDEIRIEPTPWESPFEKNSISKFDDGLECQETVSGSESSGSSQMERPLLNCRKAQLVENQVSVKSNDSISKFEYTQSESRSARSSRKERPLLNDRNSILIESKATVKRNSSDRIDNGENQDTISVSESSGNQLMEKPLLKCRNSPQVENEAREKGISINKFDNLENQDTISGSESSSSQQIEKPLLKKNCDADEDKSSVTSKIRSSLSSTKSSIQRKTWTVPSTPDKPVTPHFKKDNGVTRSTRKINMDLIDKKRSPSKSLCSLINLVPAKGSNSTAKKIENSGLSHSSLRAPAKDCTTPMKTPLVGTINGVNKYHKATTPRSETRRMKAPTDNSASGIKTTGPKWHLLSSVCTKSLTACRNKLQSPTVSTPFILRTEERAAKRKQKLEEKFNEKDVQKVLAHKTLKEKAGNEIKKLSRSFCFKARPLPDFYKENEMLNVRMKMAPAAPRQMTRSIPSNKTQGNVSMPPTPPPGPSFTQNVVSKSLSIKKVPNGSKLLPSSLPEKMTHENKSPNIQ